LDLFYNKKIRAHESLASHERFESVNDDSEVRSISGLLMPASLHQNVIRQIKQFGIPGDERTKWWHLHVLHPIDDVWSAIQTADNYCDTPKNYSFCRPTWPIKDCCG